MVLEITFSTMFISIMYDLHINKSILFLKMNYYCWCFFSPLSACSSCIFSCFTFLFFFKQIFVSILGTFIFYWHGRL